jgi:hypothetical protein
MKAGIIVALWLLGTTAGTIIGAVDTPGVIRGEVLDEKGKPAADVQVSVDPSDGRPRLSAVRVAETDKNGRFWIRNLELGEYKVFTAKESAGYPNTSYALYSNHIFAAASLTLDSPVADITLTLGPPAARLSGRVTNAENEPINATLLLRRASDPGNWISTSQRSDYRILLPSGTGVTLEASSPGYRIWYYGGPSDPHKRPPIQLESRAEMKLDIQLEPEGKPEK